MKIAVLYYSAHKGATKAIADILQEGCGAKEAEVRMKNPLAKEGVWKIIRGVALSLFKLHTPIVPMAFRPQDYDLIFIGTPVWAGSMSAPMRTALSTYDFSSKKVALFATCQNDSEKVLGDMKPYLNGACLCGEKIWENPLDMSAEALRDSVEKWSEQILSTSVNGCEVLRVQK